MKRIIRILFVFSFLLILLYIGLIVFVNSKSKEAIVNRLQTELGREVSIAEIKFLPIFGLEVEDLKIEGLLFVKDVRIFFDWRSVWQKDLLIEALWINEPDATVLRTKDNKIIFGDDPQGEASYIFSVSQLIGKVVEGLVPVQQKRYSGRGSSGARAGVVIENIHLLDGRLKYTDSLMEQEVTCTLGALNLTADFLSYPVKPRISNIELEAVIEKSSLPLEGSQVASKGWVDLLELDMKENIKFMDKKGATILDVNLNSQKNDMTVTGQVSLNNFMFKKEEEGVLRTARMEDVVLNALNLSGVDIVADFSFKTKMNDFRVEKISFSGDVGYNKKGTQKAGQGAAVAPSPEADGANDPTGGRSIPEKAL